MDAAAFLLELGGVLLALSIVARVADRFGLSPIPLYLLVGLVLGDGGVYPLVTAEGFIAVGAEIGVVLLLLFLGLEYTPEELTYGLRTGVSLAIADLVGNFTPGFLAGLLLGWSPLAAMLLGGVTYISSSGIVAKLVDDLGWLANRETPMVLSLLVSEDLVMAFYLPLAAALLVGGTAAGAGLTLTLALALAAGALFVALRYGDVVSWAVFHRSNEALLLGVLGFALLVAGAAELVHVSAAVGAFFVGLAFSGPVQERAHGILRPLRDLFAAAFFVFIGLSIDPAVVLAVAVPALLLALVTGATKYATTWWGTARMGLGSSGRKRAGTVLLARGEFSLIIAGIGMAAGVEPQLGALAAAYVLILAIVGPLLTRQFTA